MKYKKVAITTTLFIVVGLLFTLSVMQAQEKTVQTSTSLGLSNKKIGWGVKREKDHKQPDLKTYMNILNQYDGIGMGNAEKKQVYLTFDEGYEAGYTEKILETLKNNNVTATFFITAHYLNTQPELVQKMIDQGHTVGNHIPKYLMFGDDTKIKA